MRRTNQAEMQAILKLDGPTRFSHFIKRVVDEEQAWGLWNDGWALMSNDEGIRVFPLWPAAEYAQLHRDGEWAIYEPRAIPLPELLDELVPKLAETGVLPGIFPTPLGKGVTPKAEELASALRQELANYE